MRKRITIKTIAIIFILCNFLFFPLTTGAAGGKLAKNLFQSSLDTTAGKSGYDVIKKISLLSYIGLAASYVLTLLGIIFLGLTIYGGYIWMTARGNEQRAEKAKETLRSVVIGLVIVLAAYAITFWMSQVLGPQTISGYSSDY